MPYRGDTMQTGDRASDMSSSPISSAPQSPQNGYQNGYSDIIHVAQQHASAPGFATGGGVVHAHSANSAAPSTTQQTTSGDVTSKSGTASAPEKPKRARKKKDTELGPDGKPIVDDKPKKPRKPREPKDPSKPAAPRKKQKTGETTEKIMPSTPTASTTQSRQPTIADMMGGPNYQPQAAPANTAPPGTTAPPAHAYHHASDNIVRSSVPPHLSYPATARPSSSGQNYDPIRGQNYDPIRGSTIEHSRPSAPPPAVPSNGPSSAHASPHVNRASPSIASLVHPPPTTTNSPASHAYPQQTYAQPSIVQTQQSPPPNATTPFAPPQPPASPHTAKPTPMTMDGAMDVDLPQYDLPKPPEVKKAPSKSSSSAPTPKEPSKAPAVPKASGTGLLSSSNLFGGPATGECAERKNVDIEIVIPLNPAGNNTVNIAQEIIKKYGQDAINPRAAAHRAQLLRLAAQQSKMEGNTTDDMSVDLMSDVEGDSNVEMGGIESGADGAEKPKRKRRAKQEEYDKEDDFIDDTELAWQEQAAVAKDGFFVYSGPLVPEGQQAQVESSAPTRGGRGRGRGRARGAATTGTTHAGLADKKTEGSTARGGKGSRGGGRGTGVTRKPRITKADRERMEADKADRERAGGMLAQGGGQMTFGAPAPAAGPSAQPVPAQAYPQVMAGHGAS